MSAAAPKDSITVAHQYLDEFAKVVSFTNKTAATAIFFIFFSWIYIIESMHFAYLKKKDEARKELASLYLQKKGLERKIYKAQLLYDVRAGNSSVNETGDKSDTLNLKKYKEIVSAKSLNNIIESYSDGATVEKAIPDLYASNLNRLTGDVVNLYTDSIQRKIDLVNKSSKHLNDSISSQIRNNIGDIPFPFKPIFYFTGSLKNGPQSLIVLITGLIIFVFYNRRQALKYAARAIRIYNMENGWKKNKVYDLNLLSPFWLAPIPFKKNCRLDYDRYITSMGFKNSRWNYSWVILILCSLIAVELRQFWLAVEYAGNSSTAYTRNELASVASIVNFSLIVISVTFSLIWIFSILIPDDFNYERNVQNERRRHFLIIFSVITASVIVAASANTIRKIIKGNSFYRKRKLQVKLSDIKQRGWYRHIRSGKYHYFDNRGFTPSLWKLKDAAELPAFVLSLKSVAPASINQNVQPAFRNNLWVKEQYALALIENKDWSAVAEVLGNAVLSNPKNYRMLDLLVLVATKYPEKELLDKLNEIKTEFKYEDERITKTLAKHEDKAWREKMISSKKIKFNEHQI